MSPAKNKPTETRRVVYLLGGKRAQRLGTIAAPDRDAAIAKAIEFFSITEPERQKRVAVIRWRNRIEREISYCRAASRARTDDG